MYVCYRRHLGSGDDTYTLTHLQIAKLSIYRNSILTCVAVLSLSGCQLSEAITDSQSSLIRNVRYSILTQTIQNISIYPRWIFCSLSNLWHSSINSNCQILESLCVRLVAVIYPKDNFMDNKATLQYAAPYWSWLLFLT